MADNSFKINKSANFNPQAGTPANPVDGDFFYDATAQSFAYYHNGSWANIDSVGTISATDPMTSAQFTPAIVRNSVVKVNGGVAPTHLKGISASFSAKRITIYNGGSDIIVVEHEDAGEATANNRIRTPTAGDMNLIAGEVAVFTYDIIANRWLLVSISSQAGAQVIATTVNPGLVTLHQASTVPADGIVLSDGDLNTATGVVGLDANRAATIAAPLSAVTALTITAHASASALVLNYTSGTSPLLQLGSVATGSALTQKAGSDTDQFTLNNTVMQLGQRQLKFSDNDGSGNHLDNYMVYAYLGGTSRRGVQFVNGPSAGSTSFSIEGTNDGLGQARVDLTLHASTGSDQVITNQQGDLYLNFIQNGSVILGMSGSGNFTINSAFTTLWQFTHAGVLTAVGGNRAIQSVLDPVSAQDAATKHYVDGADSKNARNLVVNGSMDFWQRGTSITVPTELAIGYTADRWGANKVTGTAFTVTQQTDVPSINLFKYSLRWQRTVGNSNTSLGWLAQEIDRDMLRLYADNTAVPFTLGFWAKKGANFSGSLTVQVRTGDGPETDAWLNAGYADDTSSLSSSVSMTTSWQFFTFAITNLSNVGAGRTSQANVIFSHTPSGTAGANDWYEITGVMLTPKTTISSDYYTLAGGNIAGELALCERYFEKTYNLAEAPGTDTSGSGGYGWFTFCYPLLVSDGGPWQISSYPRFRVRKYIAPSVKLWTTAGTANTWEVGGTDRATLAATTSDSSFLVTNNTGGAITPATNSYTGGHWTADAEFY